MNYHKRPIVVPDADAELPALPPSFPARFINIHVLCMYLTTDEYRYGWIIEFTAPCTLMIRAGLEGGVYTFCCPDSTQELAWRTFTATYL